MENVIRPGMPVSQERLQQAKRFTSIYPGIVEITTDNRLLGRCRVRVPTIHRDESCVPTNALPWARPCFPAFMFDPPQVGDQVWVMFQDGDIRYPVYLGWFPTIPSVAQQMQRHPGKIPLAYDGDVDNGKPLDKLAPRQFSEYETPQAGDEPDGGPIENYVTPAGVPQTPPEVRRGRSWDPNIRGIKSWRGHSILWNDHPEAEYLKVIDRSGQMLFFDCAVDFNFDKHNVTPRGNSIENCFVKGIGEADKKVHHERTQLPIDKMRQRPGENRRASIRMTDLFGQYLEFWAEKDRANIRLQSSRRKDDDKTPNHFIEIKSSLDPKDEHILIRTREGHQIRLDETRDEIIIQHRLGSIIKIDPRANIRLSTVV